MRRILLKYKKTISRSSINLQLQSDYGATLKTLGVPGKKYLDMIVFVHA